LPEKSSPPTPLRPHPLPLSGSERGEKGEGRESERGN